MLLQTGGSGLIAAILIWFYRKDMRSYTDLWRETSMILAADRKENTAMIAVSMRENQTAYTILVRESTAAHVTNTESNREMIGLLQALHRRMDANGVPAAGASSAQRPAQLPGQL
jgi:hypothetical protein